MRTGFCVQLYVGINIKIKCLRGYFRLAVPSAAPGCLSHWSLWSGLKSTHLIIRILNSKYQTFFIWGEGLRLQTFFIFSFLYFGQRVLSWLHLSPHWGPQRVHCPLLCPPLPFLSNQIASVRKCQQIIASIHIWWPMNWNVYSVWGSGSARRCYSIGLNRGRESHRI